VLDYSPFINCGSTDREIGEIIALYWLKSPSIDSKVKLKSFLFASRSSLVNNLHFMLKLIDKAIVINGGLFMILID
jgi:hypothetical protein